MTHIEYNAKAWEASRKLYAPSLREQVTFAVTTGEGSLGKLFAAVFAAVFVFAMAI
jgi:hypothetical protein